MRSLSGLLLGVPVCPDFQFKEPESVTAPSGAWSRLPLMPSLNGLLGAAGAGSIAQDRINSLLQLGCCPFPGSRPVGLVCRAEPQPDGHCGDQGGTGLPSLQLPLKSKSGTLL